MKHITKKKKVFKKLFHVPCSMFHGEARGERGLGIIEVIVVIALIASVFVAVLQLAFFERRSQNLAQQDTVAYILAREALEATRTIRDDGWENVSNLSFDTPYYPILNSEVWEFSSSNPGSIEDIYTRWIEVSEVFRDGSGNISPSGSSDEDTLLVRAYVNWTMSGGNSRTIQLEAYLTNWQGY